MKSCQDGLLRRDLKQGPPEHVLGDLTALTRISLFMLLSLVKA
jgi:hypothetical protein